MSSRTSFWSGAARRAAVHVHLAQVRELRRGQTEQREESPTSLGWKVSNSRRPIVWLAVGLDEAASAVTAAGAASEVARWWADPARRGAGDRAADVRLGHVVRMVNGVPVDLRVVLDRIVRTAVRQAL